MLLGFLTEFLTGGAFQVEGTEEAKALRLEGQNSTRVGTIAFRTIGAQPERQGSGARTEQGHLLHSGHGAFLDVREALTHPETTEGLSQDAVLAVAGRPFAK